MVPWRPSPEEQPEHPRHHTLSTAHVATVLLEVGWTLHGAWASWRGPEHFVRNDLVQAAATRPVFRIYQDGLHTLGTFF